MSEESREQTKTPPALANPTNQPPAQNVRVDLNSASINTLYANFFRVTGTFEEMILDFGLHTGAILPQGPEPVKMSQRLVISYTTAKRLLSALEVSVQRHEQTFGTIEVEPQKRIKRSS